MPRRIFLQVALLVVVILSYRIEALEQETWVSLDRGNDSLPCTYTQPCRSIQVAVDRTKSNGVVHVDPSKHSSYSCSVNGTYITKTLRVQSEVGMTWIDCAGEGRAFWFDNGSDGSSLVGFNITNSNKCGGAVFVSQVVVMTIFNCSFYNNSAPFSNNDQHYCAVMFDNSCGSIEYSVFINNYCGISVSFDNNSNGTILINNNTAINNLNGISVSFDHNSNGTISIKNNTAINNSNGISVSFDNNSNGTISINNNVAINNSNIGIYVSFDNNSNGPISINNNTAINNSNGIYIYLYYSNGTILVNNNIAINNLDGGIYVSFGNSNGNILVNNNVAINNLDSGIFVSFGNSNGNILVNNNTAINNSNCGIFVSFDNNSNGTILVNNNTAINNLNIGMSVSFGNSNGNILVNNNTAINNSIGMRTYLENGSFYINNNNIINNTNGGLIFIGQKDLPLNIVDQYIFRTWNHYSFFYLNNNYFYGNSADFGGAISIVNGYTEMKNNIFINNIAQYNGGVIYLATDSTELKISNCIFINNSANLGGLTISSKSGAAFTLLDSILYGVDSSVTLVEIPQGGNLTIDKTVFQCLDGYTLTQLNVPPHNVTFFGSDWQSLMLQTSLIINCNPCTISTYSLTGSSSQYNTSCHPCPYGANCTLGTNQIYTRPSFWCNQTKYDSNQLECYLCPNGYCNEIGAFWSDACIGNRTGILCGSCKEGYITTFGSVVCQKWEKCSNEWYYYLFWPFIGLFAILFTLWLLHKFLLNQFILSLISQTSKDNMKKENESFSGFNNVIFYFYQVVPLLIIPNQVAAPNIHTLTTIILSIVHLSNFEVHNHGSSGICIAGFPHLDEVIKIFLESFLPLLILFLIGVIYIVSKLLRWKIAQQCPAALLEATLLTYSTIAQTVFKLLHCESIQGESRLFLSADVVCWEHWWQYILLCIMIVIIIPFPFILWIGSKLHQGHSIKQLLEDLKEYIIELIPFNNNKKATSSIKNNHTGDKIDEKSPVYNMLCGAYKKKTEYWNSVYIGRRLILIICYTFIPQSHLMLKLCVLTLLCTLFFAHHLLYQPFHSANTNKVETATLFGLIVLGVINVTKATLMNQGDLPDGTVLNQLQALYWIQIGILAVLPVLLGLLLTGMIVSGLVRFVYAIIEKCCYKKQINHIKSDDETTVALLSNNKL